MALAIELCRRLENAEEPLSKRMRLAEQTFISSNFPLNTRRNLVMKWLTAISSENNVTDENWTTTIINCFSDSFTSTEISQVAKESLLAEITQKLQTPNASVLNCAVVVFSHNSFAQYFLNDPNILQNFIKCLCQNVLMTFNANSLIKTEIINVLQKIIEQIVNFSKKSICKSDFTTDVVEVILPSLLEPVIASKSSILFNDCIRLLQRTIFDKSIDIDRSYNFMNNFLKKDILNDESLILLIKSFVHSYKNNAAFIYKFYKAVFITVEEEKLFLNKAMIDILIEYDIKLDVEISENNKKEESFLIFLQKFSLIVVDNFLSTETALILQILCSIMTLNPLIIEPKLFEIIATVSLTEKSDVALVFYESFLNLSISALVRLNRVNKLPSKLIELCTQLLKNEPSEKAIDINQVWPISAGHNWGIAISSLTHTLTIIPIMKGLFYYLENNCAVHLEEGNFENKVILITQLICRFLDDFLLNSQLISWTDKLSKNLIQLIEQGFSVLSRIAKAICIKKKFDEKIMSSFLSSSFSLGEFSLLVYYYWKPQEIQPPKPLLSMYIDPNNWKLIHQEITDFGNDECKANQNKLLCQELRASTILGSESNKNSSMEIILTKLDDMWNPILSSKITAGSILPFIEQSHLNIVIDNYIKALISDYEGFNNVLSLEHVQENEKLIESILFSVLRKISECFKRKKRKSDASGFNSLVINLCKSNEFEFEISNIKMNMDEFLKHGRNIFDYESLVSISNINLERLQLCLNIINKLPLQRFSSDCKSIIYLFVIAILSDINSAHVAIDCLTRKSCEDVILSLLENDPSVNLTQMVNYKTLFKLSKWLVQTKQILTLLLNEALNNNPDNTLSLIKGFTKLLISDINVLIQNGEVANKDIVKKSVDILTFLFGVLRKCKKKPKTSTDYKGLSEKLQIKILTSIDLCKLFTLSQDNDGLMNEYLLDLYNHLLQLYILGLRDGCINEAIKLLPIFINTALSASSVNLEPSTVLLNQVFNNKNILAEYFGNVLTTEDLTSKVWEYYYGFITSSSTGSKFISPIDACHFGKLFECAAEFPLSIIISKLLQNTLSSLNNSDKSLTNLSALLWLWERVIESFMNPQKAKTREIAIKALCQNLNNFLINQRNSATADSNAPAVLAVLNFYLSIVNNKKIPLNSTIIDSIIQSIPYLDLTGLTETNNIFILFQTCGFLMLSILSNRSALIVDRLPAVLSCFRHMVSALCFWGNANIEMETSKATVIETLGLYLEKPIDVVVKHKQDLSRFCQYFVYDLIVAMSKSPLIPPVKQTILNVTYLMLALCDEYAVNYLKKRLRTENEAVFKNVLDNYQKHQKYTGKI